ncbi:hypothetical protein [Acetobacterium paludosum]|uniref:hypothetical protein n=1 Tax=Acetobacterium paludosum TaxID=52693 RepID=UPI0014780A2E|nr:hypothetical protein [Acetobacterium paludosum]
MATKSILKSIDIKDRRLCRQFVNALKNAKGKRSITVEMSKPVREVHGKDIKTLFENN